MTSLSKVTVRDGQNKVQFQQTDEAITIFMPVQNVSLKQILIVYTSLCLKVNIKSTKYIAIIDFMHEIDHRSPKNRVQLIEGAQKRLEVYLIKAKKDLKWSHLQVQGLSRQDVIKRRNDSFDAYYKEEEARKKSAQDSLYAMDRHAIDQMTKVDAHQRNTIEKMKKNELRRAQDELLGDLEEVNQLDRKLAGIGQAASAKAAIEASNQGTSEIGESKRYGKMNTDEDIFADEDMQIVKEPKKSSNEDEISEEDDYDDD